MTTNEMPRFIVNDNGDYEWIARSKTPNVNIPIQEICDLLNRADLAPPCGEGVREAVDAISCVLESDVVVENVTASDIQYAKDALQTLIRAAQHAATLKGQLEGKQMVIDQLERAASTPAKVTVGEFIQQVFGDIKDMNIPYQEILGAILNARDTYPSGLRIVNDGEGK